MSAQLRQVDMDSARTYLANTSQQLFVKGSITARANQNTVVSAQQYPGPAQNKIAANRQSATLMPAAPQSSQKDMPHISTMNVDTNKTVVQNIISYQMSGQVSSKEQFLAP